MSGSLAGTLSIAGSGLRVAQTALQTTAHNITNAGTPGYSRQEAIISPNTPVVTPDGIFGTGTHVTDIARPRDALLDARYRQEAAGLGAGTRRSELLDQLQSAYLEPGENGLGNTLDQFWNAWGDLSNAPASSEARTVVRYRALQLTGQLQRLSRSVDDLSTAATSHLQAAISQVNQLTQTIAGLNDRIVVIETGGLTAGDLRDQRDSALDALAKLADIQVLTRSNGTIAVALGNATLVDGPTWQLLKLDGSAAGTYTVSTAGGTALDVSSGAISADLALINTDAPAHKLQLDNIAAALVTKVNELHHAARNAANQTNVDFFDSDPDMLTAGTISLSAAVAGSVDAIGAGSSGTDAVTGDPIYRSGANDVAVSIAQLRDSSAGAAVGDLSVGVYYQQMVTSLGFAARAASDERAVYDTLASEADTRRQSLVGVSTDEELTRMIQFQNAYAAAARVITTVDEMMQTLVDMKR